MKFAHYLVSLMILVSSSVIAGQLKGGEGYEASLKASGLSQLNYTDFSKTVIKK